MPRGRPASTAPTWEYQIHLRLRVGEDDDLIAFLGSLPPRRRASAIKSALRTGGTGISQIDTDGSETELMAAVAEFLK
jgi:hypothetical protein